VGCGQKTWAYAPEKTYQFQAGALIRASELNQNEDDFFNAITDGNADLTAGTVSASSFVYASLSTQYRYVDYTQFNGSTYTVSTNYSGKFSATGGSKAKAQLFIPNGATITQLYVYSTSGVTVNLITQIVAGTTTTNLAAASITTNSVALSSVVANTTYMYLLDCNIESTATSLYGVKVTYTTTKMDGTY
jgi:hypothetical protein